jgi:hypothetical protein
VACACDEAKEGRGWKKNKPEHRMEQRKQPIAVDRTKPPATERSKELARMSASLRELTTLHTNSTCETTYGIGMKIYSNYSR